MRVIIFFIFPCFQNFFLKKSFEKFLYVKFFVYHSIVVSGKRAGKYTDRKTNKYINLKNGN
jgi:hypothetical protein